MTTPTIFIADIQNWAQKFPQQMNALARQTCQQISENVITDTPVDTGFLRGSWQPSIGAPEAGNGAGGQHASSVALAAVVPQIAAGEVYYMTNNAEYAEFVEFGTSKMAPRFFVTDNVQRWEQVVEQVARDLGMT